ncbi:HAD family hydrolase [Paenibacillus sp. J22TS3]|uniref:HAD family hydrolase n=1 Tax=Paenibacillus sp. J22TS3 TaxID=2807192 RepID=UPI001B267AAA|nr:HAD-IA family hydrolase [Paenibacillus sp. J22TS3]GIP21899.1 hypothetical protein J22TS3_21740 [Paenibacillus sp. J22TS3]
MKKSFIWFDLGYTLVYQQREAVYQQFLLEQGIDLPLEEIERAYHLTDKLFMRQYPGALGKEMTTFYAWYIGVLNYTLGLHFNLHDQVNRLTELQSYTKQRWLPYSFTPEVLKWLKQKAIGVGLISNWDHSARALLDELELLDYFDHIMISSEVGVEKPDKEIFEQALHAARVTPEESLYIGDNYYDDVIGSSRVGMEALLINRFGQLGIEEIRHGHTIKSIQELPGIIQR